MKPYYLIDFENVQPKALDKLQPGGSRIKVFLGEKQTTLKLELAQALQRFGTDADYVPISGAGPNAVDFHIAYYIGRLAADEPTAAFNIISKDKGFDPLVRHLTGLGISCRRLAEIPGAAAAPKKAAPVAAKKTTTATSTKTATAAPAKKAAKKVTVTILPEPNGPAPTSVAATTTRQRAQAVLALLKKSTKPSTLAGLEASIRSWLKPAPDDKAVASIVQSLKDSKKITVTGTKVSYCLG